MRRPRAPRLPPRLRGPVPILVALVLAQWAATAVFALGVAARNGWLFFQGGDQTWLYTTAWSLGEGALPPAVVGYGWSLLLAPISWFAGPDYLAALPAIVLLQVLVFQPVALLCVYAIAARLAGRLAGYCAAAAWIVLPFAIIPLWDPRYHERYVDQFVPQALGLTGLADYPSLVVLLVAAWLALRAVDNGAVSDAVLAGLATGLALAIKPANGLFVAAPLLALALARRWVPAGAFAAALVPALVTLAVWKYRGLGHVPAFAFPEARLAGGPVALLGPLDPYISLDWSRLAENEAQLREYFWSVRLLEWLPLVGLVGVARRSLPAAALLGGWLVLFVVGKGASERAGVAVGTFFRLLMPAYPAFFLLGVGLLLLLPVLGGRIAELPRPSPPPLGRAAVAAVAVVTAVVPLAVVLAARPLDGERAVLDTHSNTYVPVTGSLALRAEPEAEGMRLHWERADGPARVFFRVVRAPADEELDCDAPRDGSAPRLCELRAEVVAPARHRTYLVHANEPGRWAYRVGVGASWNDDPEQGDVLLLSDPVVLDGG